MVHPVKATYAVLTHCRTRTEAHTGPEIAERTGLTPGSVRVNLHRGMQVLREALGRSARP